MSHANSIHLHQPSYFAHKAFAALIKYIALLASAFEEALQLEQETRKTSGNW